MEEKYLSLKQIQIELKDMLINTINFFDRNSFDYFLCAGSLLGAIRHNGFIPWDDDIDIYVSRPVYEKIINIAREKPKINDYLEIVSYELSTDMHPFIKIINRKIGVEEKEELDKYLWIDVFPLDGMPEEERKIIPYLRRSFIINQIYSLKCQKMKNILHNKSSLKKRLLKLFIKPFLFFINKDKFVNIFLKRVKKYNFEKSTYVACPVWADNSSNYYPRKITEAIAEYNFEGVKVKSFKDYNLYLSRAYGDYMKIPPEDKRVIHNIKAFIIK